MRWGEFERDGGTFGAEIRRLLHEPGVVLVATIRADGAPRLSPVEPFFWDDELWLPMMFGSRKAADLRRDPRLLVHSIITTRDGTEGEAKARGAGVPVDDRFKCTSVCDAIASQMPYAPEPDLVELFAVDVASVALVRYIEGDQHVALWPQRRRFVRRVTSATSVGPPEDESAL